MRTLNFSSKALLLFILFALCGTLKAASPAPERGTKDAFDILKIMGYIFGGQRTLGRAAGILIDPNNNTFYGAAYPRRFGQAAGF